MPRGRFHGETQTEQVPGKEERIQKKLDELKSEVAEALTSMFQYNDQHKAELIARLNAGKGRRERGGSSKKIGRGGVGITRVERDRRVVRERNRERK